MPRVCIVCGTEYGKAHKEGCPRYLPSISYDENGCLPCPFCGGKCDPEGWLGGDGERGPECETCGATTTTVNTWNARI